MQRVIPLTLLTTALLLIEYYVYLGIRSAFPSGWPLRLAIGIQVASILITVGAFLRMFTEFSNGMSISDGLSNALMGLMVTFFFTKLAFVLTILVGDLYRIGEYLFSSIASLFSDSGAEVSMEGRRKFVGQMGVALAALPFASFLFGITRGKYNYKVHHVTLNYPDLPAAFDGFKIAQISDVHAGSFDNYDAVKRGIDTIQAQQPDLILFTGDLVNNLAEEVEPYINAFKSLTAPFGKFSVMGNHDYGEYVEWPSALAKAENERRLRGHHRSMDFRLLENESVLLRKEGEAIRLAGVENWGKPPFPSKGDLDQALAGEGQNDFTVLMSHDPHHWEEKVIYNNQHVHLTLSGHTHGMQMGVDIPGLKWSPVKYRYKRWAGLYDEMGRYLYVNRGFGFIGFPGRVGIWPEITVFELKRAENQA